MHSRSAVARGGPATGRCGSGELRSWPTSSGGVSSGGTEAITGVIEKTGRLAHGFRKVTNYRLRILLAADVLTPPTVATPARLEPC